MSLLKFKIDPISGYGGQCCQEQNVGWKTKKREKFSLTVVLANMLFWFILESSKVLGEVSPAQLHSWRELQGAVLALGLGDT
jgi:hypothetical protein